MPMGILFWVLMILWLIFGFWSGAGSWVAYGSTLLVFILFLLLGWKTFGPPLQ
jgi:hypothetical protein